MDKVGHTSSVIQLLGKSVDAIPLGSGSRCPRGARVLVVFVVVMAYIVR
jgi:hypothetical protein